MEENVSFSLDTSGTLEEALQSVIDACNATVATFSEQIALLGNVIVSDTSGIVLASNSAVVSPSYTLPGESGTIATRQYVTSVLSTNLATDSSSDAKASTPKSIKTYLTNSIQVIENADNTVSLNISFQ